MRSEQPRSPAAPALALIACGMILGVVSHIPAEPALRLVTSIPLPAVEGRIDHMDYDPVGDRLFVAALGNGSVEVVGAGTSSVLASLDGISEPQGVAYVAEARRLYVASGGSGDCVVYDAASLKLIHRIQLGEDADNLHYDPVARRLYVSAGDTLRALSVPGDEPLAAAKLPGHPEGFAVSQGQARIYANVPVGSRGVFVIDTVTMTVVSRWPVGGPLGNLFSNFPLVLDDKGRRLFVATRIPPALAVIDAATGKPQGSVAIDGDADDVFYDAERGRAYVSCGAGYVDVVERDGSGTYRVRERIPTASGARTSLWVPASSTLFVAAPRRGADPARILVFRAVADRGGTP